MKYLQTMIVLVLSAFMLNAQNVGINATGANPDPSAALDIVSNNNGMLIPRVTLTGTTDATTIVNGNVNSLLVFNTATVSDVTPGYYYWSASDNAWIRLEDQNSVSDDWRLTGNAGTNPAGNFVGTTDAQDLVLRTNNTENMRIANATGFVGIGTGAPSHPLTIKPTADVAQLSLEQDNSIDGYDLWCTSATGDLIFRRSNGAAGTERMRLTAAGRLGIGTASPDNALEVNGNIEFGTGVRGAILTSTVNDNFRLTTFDNNPNANFVIGIGDGNGNGNTVTTWLSGNAQGNVGIGTTNAGGKLTINMGATDYGGVEILGENHSAVDPCTRLRIRDATGGTNWYVSANNNGTFGIHEGGVHDHMVIRPTDGQVALGDFLATFRLELPNTATNAGGRGRANAWATYSDGRIKTDQQLINYGLNTVMQLQAKQYTQHSSTFKEGKLMLEGPTEHTIGFIAQELYEVVPEAVYKPQNEDEDLWSVDYTKLTPVLVKAIQEQQKKINQQEEQINQQEEQANQQKYLIEKLIKQNEALNQRLTVLEKQ